MATEKPRCLASFQRWPGIGRITAQAMPYLVRDDFIRLLLEHYEALDPEYKAKVPLRKVWVSAEWEQR